MKIENYGLRIICYGLRIILCLCCFSTQAETLNFRNYSVKDGLANSTIYYTFQDSKGFIWFATETGVNRFDGQKFELFTMDNGLSDNEVLKIQEDSAGRIWFLTLNGKLSYYYNRKFYNTTNNPLLKKSICNATFMSFFEDSRHRLWFTTNQNKLLRIGPGNSIRFYTSPDYSFSNCYITQDDRNEIIVFGKKQILTYKGDKFIFLQTNNFPLLPKSFLNNNHGKLLYLSDQGLIQYSNRLFTVLSKLSGITNTVTGSFLRDDQQKLWVGTMGKGLLLFKATDHTPEIHLKGQNITGIMKDMQGNVWISTIGNGVYMLPFYSRSVTHFTTEDGLSSNAVNSIIKVKNDVFLGLRTGNLDILSSGKKVIHKTFNPGNIYSPVKRLYYSKETRSLWYASENNLIEVTSGGKQISILKGSNRTYALKSFSIGPKGEIAVALASGVYVTTKNFPLQFNPKKEILPRPHFLNRAFTVYYDSAGRLWFSNIQGLQYFYKGKITALYQGFPDLRQRITDIAELPDKTIICTTYGFGVFIIRNDKLVQIITTGDGLASNICKRVFPEKDKVWVVTGRGISKISFSRPAYRVNSYSTENGLISDEVNDIFAENDTVYVATNNGLSVFRPAGNSVQAAPRIYLKEVQANKKPFKPGGNCNLPYTQNNITVSYIALDFSHPSRIVYSYRLTRKLKWSETQGNTIEFGSLEPGNYQLQIRARSLNTSWSRPLQIDFTISQPFWKSWWFLLFSILATGSVLFLAIRYYFKVKQSHEKERLLVKTRIISLEQQALQAMMNPHFIFNVMNSIQYFINTGENAMANQVLTGFARLIRKNLDICNKSYINVEEEVNYLNLYLSLEKLRFGDKMNYSLDVGKEIDLQETYIPSMLLQPYVENAIWHGIMPKDSPGSIRILIKKDNNFLHIKIIDDGIGIDNSIRLKNSDHISKGMKLTIQRISLLNKFRQSAITIKVEPVVSGGTEVSIDIPLKTVY